MSTLQDKLAELSPQHRATVMVRTDELIAEQFQRDVQQFSERYLYTALNEASSNKEDANVAAFALMECLRTMISSNLSDSVEAIAEFEALTRTYVNDWKQQSEQDG